MAPAYTEKTVSVPSEYSQTEARSELNEFWLAPELGRLITREKQSSYACIQRSREARDSNAPQYCRVGEGFQVESRHTFLLSNFSGLG